MWNVVTAIWIAHWTWRISIRTVLVNSVNSNWMNNVCYWTVNWLVSHYVCSKILHRSARLRFVHFLSIFSFYSYFYLFVFFILLSKKLCINKVNAFYFSSNIFRVMKSRNMRRAVHMTRMGKKRNGHIFSVAEPKWIRQPRRLTCKWEDIIKMYIK